MPCPHCFDRCFHRVVAPFISNLIRGNSPLVLGVVVITSVLVPITLPALIQVFAAKYTEISLIAMGPHACSGDLCPHFSR